MAGERPELDGLGRMWFSANGGAFMVDKNTAGVRSIRLMPVDYEPNEFTMEEGGVVWTWSKQHLSRFDPAMPHAGKSVLKAAINLVQFTRRASGTSFPRRPRCRQSITRTTPSSCISELRRIRLAPASPSRSCWKASNAQWASTGSVGSASYNDLKEGKYVFHVRPVSDSVTGTEAVLAFTVRPPWYRTTLAWVLYGVCRHGSGGVLCLAFILSGAPGKGAARTTGGEADRRTQRDESSSSATKSRKPWRKRRPWRPARNVTGRSTPISNTGSRIAPPSWARPMVEMQRPRKRPRRPCRNATGEGSRRGGGSGQERLSGQHEP